MFIDYTFSTFSFIHFYKRDDRGIRVPIGAGSYSLLHASTPGLGTTQPHIQWVTEAIFPGVKRQGSEADHSPPPSTEAKNAWSYTSTQPTRLHGLVLS